jgi:protein-disulfide isomerase
MASRTKQKEEARARRLAEERARAEKAQRARRTRTLAGVLIAAVVVVVVAVVISSSGGGSNSIPAANSPAAKQQASSINSLVAGIPQSATTIGSPNAKVTVTEFGDLECPVCSDFATGAESQLISNDVRSGKVKLVYRSLESATGNGPNPGIFPTQQAAAYAAGQQNKAWNYILLFYHEQGQEGTNYVTPSYLQGLAQQVPGLNYTQWLSASKNPQLAAQVTADEQAAAARGFSYTPTLTIVGPKGQAQPIVGGTDYGTLESEINSVA